MRRLCAVLIPLLVTGSIHAQERVDGLVNSTADRAVEAPINKGGRIEIKASTDDSNATVKTGRTSSRTSKKNAFRIFDAWTLSASAPLAKGGEATSIVSTDGFPNAFAVKGKFTQYLVPRRPDLTAEEDQKFDNLCDDVLKKVLAEVKPDPNTVRLLVELRKAELGDQADLQKIETEAEAIATVVARAAAEESFNCDSATVTKVAKDRRVEFDVLTGVGFGWHRIWGASASVGHQKFEFVKTDLTDGVSNKTPFGASIFVAALPRRSNTLFSLGFEYQNKHKDADEKTLCPVGTSGQVECKTGPAGEPVKANAESAFFEVRKEILSRAMSLKIAYDFEKERVSFDLPIYIIPAAESGLGGGIRVAWVETEGAQFGVFVTSSFSLFTN